MMVTHKHSVQAVNFLMARQEAQQRGAVLVVPTRALVLDHAPEAAQPAQESVPEPAGDPEVPEVGCTVAFITSELSVTACPPDRSNLPVVYELRSRGQLMRRAAWEVVLELARKQAGSDDLGPWIEQEPPAPVGAHYNTAEQRPAVHQPRAVRGHENRRRR